MAVESSTNDETETVLGRASERSRKPLPAWLAPTVAGVVAIALVPLGYVLQLGALSTVTTALMLAAIAQGWNLLGGYGGYLNFGMVVFFGTGAYASAILNNAGWGIWPTLPVAALAAAVLALPIAFATLRLRGHYFAIFTLAITFLVQVAAYNLSITGGGYGIYTTAPVTGARPIAVFFYIGFLVLLVAVTAGAYFVEHSNFGYALRAILEDEDAASVLGVHTTAVKLWALLLGAAVAGVAGGLYAFQIGYMEPSGTFNLGTSLDVVLICVIGGLGSWQGPAIGAAIIVPLSQWLNTSFAGMHPFGWSIPHSSNRVVLGLLLVFFALYARRGVVGLFRRRRGRKISV